MRRVSSFPALALTIAIALALAGTAVPRAAMAGSAQVRVGPVHHLRLQTKPIFGHSDASSLAVSPWTEVIIDVASPGASFRGWFELRTLTHEHDSQTESRHPLVIAEDQEVRFQLPIQADGGNRSHAIAIFDGDLPATDEEARARRPLAIESMLVGSPRDGIVLTSFDIAARSIPTCRECAAPTLAHALQTLPRSTASYDNVRMFLIDGEILSARAPTKISEHECEPLREWVERGGWLVVVESTEVRTRPRAPLPCGLGESPVTDAMADRRAGDGRVVFLSTASLASTEGPATLGRLYAGASASHVAPYAFTDPARFGRLEGARWLGIAASTMLVFSLFAGPVLFNALRRRKRPERALTLLPAASLATFVVLLGVAALARPRKGESRVTFFDYANGQRVGRATVARGFLRPEGVVRTQRALVGSQIENVEKESGLEGRDHYRVEANGTIVLNEDRPKTDFVVLVETGPHTLPGPISIACTHDACTVDNESGSDLDDANIVVPRRGYVHAGRIGRRATIPLVEFSKLDELLDFDVVDSASPWLGLGSAAVSLVATQRAARDTVTTRVTCSYECEGAR